METSDTERVVKTKSSVTILLPLLPGYLTRFKAIQIRKSVRKTYISLPIPYTGGAGGVGSNPAAPNNFSYIVIFPPGVLLACSAAFFSMFLIILLPMHTASVQNDRSGYAYRYGE